MPSRPPQPSQNSNSAFATNGWMPAKTARPQTRFTVLARNNHDRSRLCWRPMSPRCCSARTVAPTRSEEHTSELQSHLNLVCRLLLEKKKSHTYQYHLP